MFEAGVTYCKSRLLNISYTALNNRQGFLRFQFLADDNSDEEKW